MADLHGSVKNLASMAALTGFSSGLLLLFQYCGVHSIPFPIEQLGSLGAIGFAGMFFALIIAALLVTPAMFFKKNMQVFRLFYNRSGYGVDRRALRYFAAVPGLAQAIGVLGSFALVGYYHLFLLLVVLGVVALVALSLADGLLPEPTKSHNGTVTLFLGYLGWTCLVFWLLALLARRLGMADTDVGAVLGVCVLLLGVGLAHFLMYPERMTYMGMLKPSVALALSVVLSMVPFTGRPLSEAGIRLLGLGGGRQVDVAIRGAGASSESVKGRLALAIGEVFYVTDEHGNTVGIPRRNILKMEFQNGGGPNINGPDSAVKASE